MSERISIKPDVCNGRPVVRGTRITVQTVLEFLAAGDSVEDVLEEYPKLTRADVKACLDYDPAELDSPELAKMLLPAVRSKHRALTSKHFKQLRLRARRYCAC
jgi:uncharacterized protein (DUF433 family)